MKLHLDFYKIISISSALGILAVVGCSVAQNYEQTMKSYTRDISLQKIESYHKLFQDPKNSARIFLADENTEYFWQNISRVFKVAMILRDGPVSELPVALDDRIGAFTFTLKQTGETTTIDQFFERTPLDAIMVVHRGEIVYEGYKTMRPFDKHNWFSTGKVISGTLIAMLEAEGKVDVSKPVSDYISELKDSVWDTVKVEDVLDMATGLDGRELDDPDAFTNPKHIWYRWAVGLGLFYDPTAPVDSPWEPLRQMQRVKPAGEAFEYNSINTWVLELIVERVTGNTLNEVLGERIWRPIGATGDGFFGVSKDGAPMTFAFMNSTLQDLARFGMIYTPSVTKIANEPILPASAIEKMQTQPNSEMYGKGMTGKEFLAKMSDTDIRNRYQWDAIFPDGDISKSGFGGQGLYVSPSRDLVVVWFSTNPKDNFVNGEPIVMVRELAKARFFNRK